MYSEAEFQICAKGEWHFAKTRSFGPSDSITLHFCICGEVLMVHDCVEEQTMLVAVKFHEQEV